MLYSKDLSGKYPPSLVVEALDEGIAGVDHFIAELDLGARWSDDGAEGVARPAEVWLSGAKLGF